MLPPTPRHCWPHLQGGVTVPPKMDSSQSVCLLPTCPGSHTSLALGSRMVPHILSPGSPCLGPWLQGMNVHFTESLHRCPSPKAASFCKLGFASEEGCQSIFPFLLFFGTLHSDVYIFPFLLCFSCLFFSQLFVRPPQTAILLFHFFSMGMVLIPVSCTMSRISFHS